MKPSRVDFYDPLYDFVTFEEAARPRGRDFLDVGFARKGSPTHGESISPLDQAKFILPFLSTFEFSRQSFLRQSSLAFLVYPSATHTRLAHSVGACYLGFLAAQRVAVADGLGEEKAAVPIYLSEFLETTGWREEFYLALLLHDVGHFPFSHCLEADKEFWSAFGREVSHEEAACELIQGRGDLYDASTRRRAGVSPSIRKAHPHLAKLFADCPKIDSDAICYLISGKESFIVRKVQQRTAQLRVIHELVSGLLDLDRVDHYRRDNMFTGLRSGASLNFASLLSGLTVCYNSRVPEAEPQLRLAPHAVGHAISLLQTKERLTEDCFEHPVTLAYEAMFHRAFNMFVFGDQFYGEEGHSAPCGNRELVFDLLASTDEEVLDRFSREGSQAVRNVSFRVRYRDPYVPVARVSFAAEHGNSLREIREVIASVAKLPVERVATLASKKFGRKRLKVRTDEWLDLQRLLHSDGRQLIEGKYRRQIEHFTDAEDKSRDVVWVFGDDERCAAKVAGVIDKVCRRLKCREEEL